ncbi:MAG TPA: hypothetical protein VM050_09030 [Patescibacteria group bacterium]|nr:hypothetical protein [Patescibacteria group bacterium]
MSDRFVCGHCDRVVRADRFEGKRMMEYRSLKAFRLCPKCIRR